MLWQILQFDMANQQNVMANPTHLVWQTNQGVRIYNFYNNIEYKNH